MDLACLNNRGIVGFKYFGFGGLAKDTKGVKAFEGTRKGDGTLLNLNLTPGGKGAFRIHVMLDGPYDNATWKGREIGMLEVPAEAAKVPTTFQVPVPAVENLKGKHAIYLVVEGPDVEQPRLERPRFGPQVQQAPIGLFDLHGIGFSKPGTVCERPTVPSVTITVDGRQVKLPSTPVRASNTNGYTDVTHYQVYAPVTGKSVIKAVASDPAVRIAVSPIVEGRATVKCTYQGQDKVYLIN